MKAADGESFMTPDGDEEVLFWGMNGITNDSQLVEGRAVCAKTMRGYNLR